MKNFRVYLSVEELIDDTFIKILDGCEVANTKNNLLLSLKRQYDMCKEWLENNIKGVKS